MNEWKFGCGTVGTACLLILTWNSGVFFFLFFFVVVVSFFFYGSHLKFACV